jgi:hypothetical protein
MPSRFRLRGLHSWSYSSATLRLARKPRGMTSSSLLSSGRALSRRLLAGYLTALFSLIRSYFISSVLVYALAYALP